MGADNGYKLSVIWDNIYNRGISMNVLFTAFGTTASELLLQEVRWQGLVLPNNKRKDAELLKQEISSGKYSLIISFGQKPNILDKVYIETTARNAGDTLETEFDYEGLAGAFLESQIEVRISHNAGTSFCNHLYWSGLEYIRENHLDVKMVFVHIPMQKNISDFKKFCEGIRTAVEKII